MNPGLLHARGALYQLSCTPSLESGFSLLLDLEGGYGGGAVPASASLLLDIDGLCYSFHVCF